MSRVLRALRDGFQNGAVYLIEYLSVRISRKFVISRSSQEEKRNCYSWVRRRNERNNTAEVLNVNARCSVFKFVEFYVFFVFNVYRVFRQ